MVTDGVIKKENLSGNTIKTKRGTFPWYTFFFKLLFFITLLNVSTGLGPVYNRKISVIGPFDQPTEMSWNHYFCSKEEEHLPNFFIRKRTWSHDASLYYHSNWTDPGEFLI